MSGTALRAAFGALVAANAAYRRLREARLRDAERHLREPVEYRLASNGARRELREAARAYALLACAERASGGDAHRAAALAEALDRGGMQTREAAREILPAYLHPYLTTNEGCTIRCLLEHGGAALADAAETACGASVGPPGAAAALVPGEGIEPPTF